MLLDCLGFFFIYFLSLNSLFDGYFCSYFVIILFHIIGLTQCQVILFKLFGFRNVTVKLNDVCFVHMSTVYPLACFALGSVGWRPATMLGSPNAGKEGFAVRQCYHTPEFSLEKWLIFFRKGDSDFLFFSKLGNQCLTSGDCACVCMCMEQGVG